MELNLVKLGFNFIFDIIVCFGMDICVLGVINSVGLVKYLEEVI